MPRSGGAFFIRIILTLFLEAANSQFVCIVAHRRRPVRRAHVAQRSEMERQEAQGSDRKELVRFGSGFATLVLGARRRSDNPPPRRGLANPFGASRRSIAPAGAEENGTPAPGGTRTGRRSVG